MKYAVYTGTRNLYDNMVPAVKSMLINSDVDKIYLLIEDDKFPVDLPKEVECINVSDQKYFKPDGPNMKSPFSYMALMRAALPKVFPDLDTILSLDVDTIVDKDISDIWDLPLGDQYYFAATPEVKRSENGLVYTNAGVTLFNLKKLRDDGKVDEVIDVLNTAYFRWVDQDVLNYLCQGRIYEMPSDYNDTPYTKRPNAIKIKHYAGMKEYGEMSYFKKYRAIPFSEIRKK